MIPVRHTGDNSAYRHYIRDFKKEITKVISKGYLVRGHFDWASIEACHNSLPPAVRGRYIKGVGNGYKKFSTCKKKLHSHKRDIMAPERMLSDNEIRLLTDLRDNLDDIAWGDTDRLKDIIRKFQPRFPVNKDGNIDKKSETYKTVYRVFVNYGYNKAKFKEIVWKMTNLRVCPYCNRTYIPFIHLKGKGQSIKGQLDHFFPKETYPYLAVSIFNLVPSCSYCNGVSCKSTSDPNDPKTRLVSPFGLRDHKGMRFRLRKFDANIFDLEKCAESIDLGIDISANPAMNANVSVFHLRDIYMAHRDIAAEIIFRHRAISKPEYIDFIRSLLKDESLHISMKELSLIYWGVPLSEERLGDRPMSKFTLDLIDHLSESKTSGRG